jgi:isocitrate dehydrogenase
MLRIIKTADNVATRKMATRAFSSGPKIVYTDTDEAPYLATYAFLPVIKRFADPAGVNVEKSDISVAARILAQFGHHADTLAELGELCKTPEANVIKLPNVSASIPQLTEAIAELQSQGYDIPNFPANPSTAEEKDIHAKYSNVLGSAVNPVLREGNSDRRVAAPVKEYAQKNPHKMGAYDPNCRSEVVHMQDDDFFSSEQSYIMPDAGTVRIEHVASDGTVTVMKDNFELQQGEVIDASKMDCGKLCEFFEKELTAAKEKGLMISLHMKATMMKVSDPIMFGHCVKVYYKDVFAKHGATFDKIGANPNNGIGDIYEKIATLPDAERKEIEADLMATYETRPGLAMVNSNKGITNLHVPSDVIIDASMPVVVRDSGKMWNKDDALEDVVCMVPDRSYAPFYKTVLEDCKKNGQFDVSTMGNVPNVGLMAQKAEEYGSHDKTFEIATGGTMRVVDGNGKEVFTHAVNEGDIWRMAQTKDAPIKDWVRLAVSRARATGSPAVFWLDANRAHDASLMSLVDKYLAEHDTSGLDIHVMKPVDAVQFSMDRARKGEDTISVTGNVLRDYLTDLFPILELGTSAKMLSIVPLLAGGGLFETGAGGSAPKHVQQFVEEGHLRWDSLGEYLALAVAFEDLGEKTNNERAKLLGQTLTEATGKLLDNRKAPSRKVNELDNRGSTFYIAMYWAEAMAKHDSEFEGLAKDLADNETKIIDDLIQCQGTPIDIGGYYKPDPVKTEKAMRPSETFNNILGN